MMRKYPKYNSYGKELKSFLADLIQSTSLLKTLFIGTYRLFGRKPWSIGYSVYKYQYIKKAVDNHLDVFKEGRLPSGYGFGLDERVVEYPWVFSRLKSDAVKILDAGSTLNHKDILAVERLRNRKLYISTLSYEGVHKSEHTPSYIYEDLREMCYNTAFFDAVICISTLEHVGMDNTFLYTSDSNKRENDKYAFLNVIKEIKRVLKKGGTLYLTVPYGRYEHHQWFQVFDAPMLEKLKEQFSPAAVSEIYFKYEHKQWNFSDATACSDGYYFDIHREKEYREDYLAASQCIACLEMTK